RGRGIHMVLAEAGIKQNCVPAEAAPHRGVALAIPLSPRGRAWERATETQCAETKKASVCHAHRSNKCDLSHIMVKPFGLYMRRNAFCLAWPYVSARQTRAFGN